jgi:hypothetical protein
MQIMLQVQQMSSMPQQQQYKGLLDALRRIPQQEGGVRVRQTAAHAAAHQTDASAQQLHAAAAVRELLQHRCSSPSQLLKCFIPA